MHNKEFTRGMRGEFRGDCSRDTFDPYRRFSRVLMQQGRVQLDADWNEQTSIVLHYLRALGADVMGPHAAPPAVDGSRGKGFAIAASGAGFTIAAGHYYVNGILCENHEPVSYFGQQDLPLEEAPLEAGDHLVYLDVWERHIHYVADDYIREKALAGPDTASRAKVVWQVKTLNIEPGLPIADLKKYEDFLALLAAESRPGSAGLRARARRPAREADPCLISPEASYRGPENQLYRVEIHRPGEVTAATARPTFKWSRENASVVFPVTAINSEVVSLEHLGRDARFGLKPNDWVEVVDDHTILSNRAETLLQVRDVDTDNRQVTLSGTPGVTIDADDDRHPHLRRWDQKGGDGDGIPVAEGEAESDWLVLEDGVEIQFPPPQPDAGGNVVPHRYQTGDYWLIPARTATGDVEWPSPVGEPEVLPAQGVQHHYAPLWRITVDASGNVGVVAADDLRRKLKKIWD